MTSLILLGQTIQSVTGTYVRSTPEVLEEAINRLTEPRGAVIIREEGRLKGVTTPIAVSGLG